MLTYHNSNESLIKKYKLAERFVKKNIDEPILPQQTMRVIQRCGGYKRHDRGTLSATWTYKKTENSRPIGRLLPDLEVLKLT